MSEDICQFWWSPEWEGTLWHIWAVGEAVFLLETNAVWSIWAAPEKASQFSPLRFWSKTYQLQLRIICLPEDISWLDIKQEINDLTLYYEVGLGPEVPIKSFAP